MTNLYCFEIALVLEVFTFLYVFMMVNLEYRNVLPWFAVGVGYVRVNTVGDRLPPHS